MKTQTTFKTDKLGGGPVEPIEKRRVAIQKIRALCGCECTVEAFVPEHVYKDPELWYPLAIALTEFNTKVTDTGSDICERCKASGQYADHAWTKITVEGEQRTEKAPVVDEDKCPMCGGPMSVEHGFIARSFCPDCG